MLERDKGFDALRAIAALCVVVIHINFDTSDYDRTDLFLKTVLRWCVPAFFLMSGYFLGGGDLLKAVTGSKIIRILKICICANILFAPLLFLSEARVQASDFILGGSWVHLWFLNSMFFGLLFLRAFFSVFRSHTLFSIISGAVFVSIFIEDFRVSYKGLETTDLLVLLRFMQSAPLIWLGFLIRGSRFEISFMGSIFLLAVGVVMCVAEAFFLLTVGAGSINPQFPVGAIFMTFGFIFLFREVKVSGKGFLSHIGERYSLHVYILHPVVLVGLKYVCLSLGLSGNSALLVAITLGPTISVVLPFVLERAAPRFFEILCGRWSFKRAYRSV